MSNRLSPILVVGLILAISLPAACQTETKPKAIPSIETFMQIGAAGGGQITADGSTLFFSTSMSGVDQVYKLSPSGWPYQMTVFTDGIDFFRISPSGRWVVVGASVGGSEQADFFLIDTPTGTISTLKQDEKVRHGMPLWSNDEKYLYFSSNEENIERTISMYQFGYGVVQGLTGNNGQGGWWTPTPALAAMAGRLYVPSRKEAELMGGAYYHLPSNLEYLDIPDEYNAKLQEQVQRLKEISWSMDRLRTETSGVLGA